MYARTTFFGLGVLVASALAPAAAEAGCGCDKPPPPRAAVRPFVGYANQQITLFDDRLDESARYDVRFETLDGAVGWSRGRVATKRDFADRRPRRQLRVRIPVVGLGPCAISVWVDRQGATPIYALGDEQFTVAAEPLTLHDSKATVSRRGYQAAVGRDGTLYIPLDLGKVDGGTRFTGTALGLPVTFQAENVAMYNAQGFLMQLLDPAQPGLFALYAGAADMSDTLSYWRHEFRTYKAQHREDDRFGTDDDSDWHGDGSPHVDHDGIVVAVRATDANGAALAPGATPPFQLVLTSEPEER